MCKQLSGNSKLQIKPIVRRHLLLFIMLFGIFQITYSTEALSQTLPSSVDVGRIAPEKPKIQTELPKIIEHEAATAAEAPRGADKVHFKLHNIIINGATIFGEDDFKPLYQNYLNQDISLSDAYQLASKITKLYQDQGYFLTRAYVPEQNIDKTGNFRINVVEGYIAEVEYKGDNDNKLGNYLVAKFIAQLKQEKPINIKTLEHVVLSLSSINSGEFKSELQKITAFNAKQEGAVRLVLTSSKKLATYTLETNNHNSMYLGPYQALAAAELSPFNGHKTSLVYLNSMPLAKLKYLMLNHNIALWPNISVDFYASGTRSEPGYTLSSNQIRGKAENYGAAINYSVIKQRQENLTFRVKLDSRDSETTAFNNIISEDRIRSLRLITRYDRSDLLLGYNFFDVTFSQGLEALGANDKDAANPSRTGVNPEARKLELSWQRWQNFGKVTLITASMMQFSNGALYASEQLGFGGMSFGRAYNPSELTGDKGMLGSLELRYNDIPDFGKFHLTPFIYYDIGKLWSVYDASNSGSSAGGGFNLDFAGNASLNFTIAQPLTKEVSTPQYGNGKSPRFLAGISVRF